MGIMAIPGILQVVITLAIFCVNAFALADAAMRPTAAFPAADKQTKPFWLIVLGLALVAGFVLGGGMSLLQGRIPVGGGLGLFTLICAIAGLVYVLGVRPAVREAGGNGRRSEGPYGPHW